MGRLVLVHTAASATEGHLLRGRLEAEGIPVFVKGEGDGPYRMGPLHLWVAEEHEVQALLVLAEVSSGSLAIEEDEVPDDSLPGDPVPDDDSDARESGY